MGEEFVSEAGPGNFGGEGDFRGCSLRRKEVVQEEDFGYRTLWEGWVIDKGGCGLVCGGGSRSCEKKSYQNQQRKESLGAPTYGFF